MKSPCDACICLPMCLSKNERDIVRCSLLYPIFYKVAHSDSYPSEVLEFDAYKNINLIFIVTRVSPTFAYVDIRKNENIIKPGSGLTIDIKKEDAYRHE